MAQHCNDSILHFAQNVFAASLSILLSLYGMPLFVVRRRAHNSSAVVTPARLALRICYIAWYGRQDERHVGPTSKSRRAMSELRTLRTFCYDCRDEGQQAPVHKPRICRALRNTYFYLSASKIS